MSLLPVDKVCISSLDLSFGQSRLTIEATPFNMNCNAQPWNPRNPLQQWQLVYYPDVNALAMLMEIDNAIYALSALSGEDYPALRTFQWDPSYLWTVPGLKGDGIATLRDPGWCLTWKGPSGWKPGDRLQYWAWHGQHNQRWKVWRA